MSGSAARIAEEAATYATSFDRVATGLDEFSELPARLTSDAELLDRLEQVSRLARLVDAERVRIAGEIARRSPTQDEGSLAKQMGATSASALVAERAGLSGDEAGKLVVLGSATRPREALTGEPLPPTAPGVAAALDAGTLPIVVATAIVRCLRKVAPRLGATKMLELEGEILTAVADGWTVDTVLAYLKRVPEIIDGAGAQQRDEDLVKLAKVLEIPLDSGLTRFILDLDPVTAGLFKTAMDAGSSLKRPALFLLDGGGCPEGPAGAVSEADAAAEQTDRRPIRERRVDGVRLMANRALKMDDGDIGGTAVTMLVTIDEESLRTRVGSACIDGIDQPISASTARALAASAEIIPVVLGGESQPLDTGAGRRFFTRAQRRAMAARDGGCAGPACRAPVSACDAAHIRPAGYGPTSIENGVLLCWHCHRLLDLHGWQISREHGRWWWTPPPWIDIHARPRPGGRISPPHLAA